VQYDHVPPHKRPSVPFGEHQARRWFCQPGLWRFVDRHTCKWPCCSRHCGPRRTFYAPTTICCHLRHEQYRTHVWGQRDFWIGVPEREVRSARRLLRFRYSGTIPAQYKLLLSVQRYISSQFQEKDLWLMCVAISSTTLQQQMISLLVLLPTGLFYHESQCLALWNNRCSQYVALIWCL